MKSFVYICLVTTMVLCLASCRHDFSVRTSVGQKVVFMSSGALHGERENFLQYDNGDKMLYSQQSYFSNAWRSVVRKYHLTRGLQCEWDLPIDMDAGNEFTSAALQAGALYWADFRPWMRTSLVDNLSMVNLTSQFSKPNHIRTLSGVLNKDESCRGVMPLGRTSLLLKVVNMKTLVPSLAIFDVESESIINRLELDKVEEGLSVWYWNIYSVSVSPDRKMFVLKKDGGDLLLYDTTLCEKARLHIGQLLCDERMHKERNKYRDFFVDWIESNQFMVWSRQRGLWWLCNIEGMSVVDRGAVSLREKCGGRLLSYDEKEYISCVLGRRKFLIKGCDEGVFVKEGYIVTMDSEGGEIREKVDCGMWPKKMLTEEYFYAEEF